MSSACSRAGVGEGERLVVGPRDVPVGLQAADHLVHRGGGHLHGPGDVGAGHGKPGLLQPEDDLQVLLLGDGRVLGGHEWHATRRAEARPSSPRSSPSWPAPRRLCPEGDEWRYEPKWDGFRTLAFKNGDDVYLQSRGGKPMNRYFPDVVTLVEKMPADQVVLDGEMVIEVDGVQEFDLLSQRIHPAESRVTMLAEKYPAGFIAFDLLAVGGKSLMDLGYEERRERLKELDLSPSR